MLEIFLDDSKIQIETIESLNDVTEISKIAHRVKPSLDTLSNEGMKNLVRKIEMKEFEEDQQLLELFIEEWKKLIQEVEEAL
jgi:HPt (histidine-containing phosphotransfer) domain-containing protein